MKILFATNHLWANTGSELALLELAHAAKERGHEPSVFAQFIRPKFAESLRLSGISAVNSKDQLDRLTPQVVYCQHHTTATIIRSHLPRTPILLAHLGVEPELEQSPLVELRISRHLAVSEEVRQQLRRQGVSRWRITVFRNAVSTPNTPTLAANRLAQNKAVLFSYKLSAAQKDALRQACELEGLSLDEQSMTANGNLSRQAIFAGLSEADIVFASGRSAIEASMCGAAVVVMGPRGLDGAITKQRAPLLAHANLSGRRFAETITIDSVRAAIQEALAANPIEARAEILRLFDVRQRARELEVLCAAAERKGVRQLSEKRMEKVRRLEELLHVQATFGVAQKHMETVDKI